jgi:hypothetical protein
MTAEPATRAASADAPEGLVQVGVRLSQKTVAAIDAERRRRPDRPSRAAMIRALLEEATGTGSDEVLPDPGRLEQVLR